MTVDGWLVGSKREAGVVVTSGRDWLRLGIGCGIVVGIGICCGVGSGSV